MPTINVHIDTYLLENALKKKAVETKERIERFKVDILNIAMRTVQRYAPRGKTGRLKAAVQKDNAGVFISKNIAPYRDFVIDGRGAFCRKKAKALRFWIHGKIIFRKCVGPAKAQPFVDTAFPEVETKINQETRNLENWLESL